MKKSKLYLILAIITAVILFATAAICNQCSPDEELTPPDEEPPPEEPPEEPEPPPEEPTKEELSVPTIDLEIYEGPLYSEADSVCYYRVKAAITGNPTPEVEFSKDDSSGVWGSTKCQINLESPSETYTLTATATNSEGEDSDSIEITWGCEEEPADDGEGVVFKKPEEEIVITITGINSNPQDIGYLVYPSGVNTETCIFGDSISDQRVQGFFGFGNLSSLSGRTLESATLTCVKYKTWDEPDPDRLSDIRISLQGLEIFPLDDWDWTGISDLYKDFPYYQDTLVWSGDALKNAIQERIDSGEKIEFRILYYPNFETDEDGKTDGKEYRKNGISLSIEYSD